jgi:glutaredoxin
MQPTAQAVGDETPAQASPGGAKEAHLAVEANTMQEGNQSHMAAMQIVLYTQPGCLSCELMRVYLDAREIAYEERDISTNPEARRAMLETYGSNETPTMVLGEEVITGFDPGLLDQLLDSPSSSDSVA